MDMMTGFHSFSDRAAASAAVAEWIETALRDELADSDQAGLIVSGGSTPAPCFELLSQVPLAWDRVQLFMSDERCVPPSHEASNEAMVRRTLGKDQAADLEVVPVYRDGLDVDGMCLALADCLGDAPRPFATALLGMGADGHFASLFPDFDQLAAGLDLNGGRSCLPVATVASPHPRITLTLPTLVDAREVLLLIFGDDKRAVLEQAWRGEGGYPVQALLEQDRAPLRVAWAP